MGRIQKNIPAFSKGMMKKLHPPWPTGSLKPLPAKNIDYALLLDMVGDKDLHLTMEQNSLNQSRQITKGIWQRAHSLGLSAFQDGRGPSVLDDHMPIQSKGVPAIDIIDFEYPPWHTMGDTPDKCSAYSLGMVGRLVASLAFRGLP